MKKSPDRHKYLMCDDHSCLRRRSPGKWTKKHIRSDNWPRGYHKDCPSKICDCHICIKAAKDINQLSAPVVPTKKI